MDHTAVRVRIDGDDGSQTRRLHGGFAFAMNAKLTEDARRAAQERLERVYTDMMRTQPERGILPINKFPFFVIMPDSTFVTVWNYVVFVGILTVAVMLPVELAFDALLVGRWMDGVLYAVFIADLALNFTISYRDQAGRYVLEFHRIARHYVHSSAFPIDLLSVVPMSLLGSMGLFKALRAIKSGRTKKLARMLHMVRVLKLRRYSVIELSMLLISVALSVHWAACAWRGIGDHWRCGDERCEETSEQDLYVACLYHGWKTLLFGDSTPHNNREKLLAIAISGVGVLEVSFIIGMLTNVIQQAFEEQVSFNRETNVIKHWLQHLNMTEDDDDGSEGGRTQRQHEHAALDKQRAIKDRVSNYHTLLWERHRLLPSGDAHGAFKMLNPSLRHEVKVALYLEMLRVSPIFSAMGQDKDSFESCLTAIADCLQTKYYLKEDSIVIAGMRPDGLYIVDLGVAGILRGISGASIHLDKLRRRSRDKKRRKNSFTKQMTGELHFESRDPSNATTGEDGEFDTRVVENLYEVGDAFGHLGVVLKQLRKRNVLALTWARMLFLPADDWYRLAEIFPELTDSALQDLARDGVDTKQRPSPHDCEEPLEESNSTEQVDEPMSSAAMSEMSSQLREVQEQLVDQIEALTDAQRATDAKLARLCDALEENMDRQRRAAVASLPAEVAALSDKKTPARATRSMDLEGAFEKGHIRAAEYHQRLLAGDTTVDVPVD